jgi:hypothetical protein
VSDRHGHPLVTYNLSREESVKETPSDLPSVSWDTLSLLKGLHKAYFWGWLGYQYLGVTRGYLELTQTRKRII